MQNKTPKVTVILPAYNEAAAIPHVLPELLKTLSSDSEIIVVDDGSSDCTADIASTYRCRVIRHTQNQGKGAAVRTGLRAARGKFIVLMDADNTYPAKSVLTLITLLEQYDFVRAIRQPSTESMPLVNHIGNKIFDVTLKVVHGLQGGDHLTGLYGLRREALDQIKLNSDGFDLEVEIGIKARALGLSAVTFPIEYRERVGKKKLQPLRDGWRILRRILRMALVYNPVFSFVVPGAVLCGLAVVVGILLGLWKTGGLGLKSFIVVAGGVTAGFHLMVFGVVAALYGITLGAPTKKWLVDLASKRMRQRFYFAGGLMFSVSVALLSTELFSAVLGLSTAWVNLAAAAFLMMWSVEIVVASLFVSIFTEKLERPQLSNPVLQLPVKQPDFIFTEKELSVLSEVR